MRCYYFCKLLVLAALAVSTAGSAKADTISQWSFTTTQAPPYNSPAPSTGSGTAITLGMTNSYNGGNTASDDVVLTTGTANTSFSEDTWRIRGTSHNGWATHTAGAAQYTQGIELDASTVGFQNIGFSFDWYDTNNGIRDLQFQYNLDTTNPAGWTNFGGTSPTGTYIGVPNDFYGAATPTPIFVDLSSISGASNNSLFGIRLVSAYDSTGNVGSEYASTSLSGGNTVAYGGTSGNWRFGNLTFSGAVAVPEPSTFALVGVGAIGLVGCSLRRRKVNR